MSFLILCVVIILLFIYDRIKHKRLYHLAGQFPGPLSLPVLGNSLNFLDDSHGILMKILRFGEKYGRFYRLWNGGKFYLMCTDYKDAEVILGSTVHITKSESYRFVRPWIGEGTLTATGSLWRRHRKLITPAFHFKILIDFIQVFNKNTEVFCEILSKKVGRGEFDIYYDVKLLALDNIYETAMGICMNVQINSDSSYVRAVKEMSYVASLRFFKVWLMFESLFKMSKYWKIQENALNILHKATETVIKTKLGKSSEAETLNNLDAENGDKNFFPEKKRRAFLDLLLQSPEAYTWSNREFREEVDTILFAGHDTVSSGISFALYCLSQNPDVQEKVHQEQLEIFGNSDRLPTYEDIQQMKYLERVLKEVQRVYPSVPITGREINEELELPGNVIVPKGTQLNILICSIHRDPRIWKNPNEFNPDNFLPEAIASRSSYSYIPFSAGPRNCLGQKYALLEMKTTIGIIIRKFKFLPCLSEKDNPLLAAELILVSKNGINLRVEHR